MYSKPYNVDEIRKNYSKLASKLLADPAHKWRAETGIELIHKEPTREELVRIWKNWQEMSKEQKKRVIKKVRSYLG